MLDWSVAGNGLGAVDSFAMRTICPLASGSKGNAVYVTDGESRLLFDAGISCRALVGRLAEIGVAIEEIDGVVVSHEHGDHIRAIDQLTVKYGTPVFANADTARALGQLLKVPPKLKIFTTGETFHFGNLEIHPFSIQHDTYDPVAFTVKMDDVKIGICTDLGFVTSLVRAHLEGCDYLYIESNHEPELVHAAQRPPLYKQRVLSRQGHLSNQACAQLLSDIHHEGLKHVYLAHLSSDCNQDDLALQTIRDKLIPEGKNLTLSIAKQERVSERIDF